MSAAAIAHLLGGPKVLRTRVKSDLDFVRMVQAGFPVSVVDAVISQGLLTLSEVEQLVIPRRTLAHRKKKHQLLSTEESDRLARVARVIALAKQTLGDQEKAGIWIRRPNRALKGARPLDLLETDGGAQVVEAILSRVAHGVFS
jgi:putative toxin-antitoxin system antitoxin component (TIGR02293 family)